MLKRLVTQDKIENDGRVDPRVKRSRKMLQNAFDELLVEKGFPNITVNDIAERASVNRATFYLHFEDKYALLRYNLRESFTQLLEERVPGEPTFSIETLHLLTATFCEFLGRVYRRCHSESGSEEAIMLLAHLQHFVYELLLVWMTRPGQGQKRATRRNLSAQAATYEPSLEDAAAALSWLVFGSGIQAQISPTQQPPEYWAQQMLALVTPGVRMLLEASSAGNSNP